MLLLLVDDDVEELEEVGKRSMVLDADAEVGVGVVEDVAAGSPPSAILSSSWHPLPFRRVYPWAQRNPRTSRLGRDQTDYLRVEC